MPVFNGERTLPALVERLMATLASEPGTFEILLVDDGSRDGSWPLIQRLAGEHAPVRGVALSRNHGQHNALLCGIREASGDVIVTMDDDLQNRPEDVPMLLARLRAGGDVVYGVPARPRWSLFRNLSSRVTKLMLQRAMGAETAQMISGFRAFRARLRDAFADYDAMFVNVDVLLTWGGGRFAAVPVTHEPRAAGQSNYTLAQLFRHTLNLVTGFSLLPLRVATGVGFALALFGAGVLAYVLGRYVLQGVAVQGFTFLASIIAIFAGGQLFALGIMGEYLGRMFQRTNGQPSYSVRDRTS